MGGIFKKRTIDDVPIAGKTVLLRVDYNVPLTEKGKIADDFRIRASLPTINKLLEMSCKVVIISHLGRPDGKPNDKYSLEPAAERLATLLKRPVRFVDRCTGEKAHMAVKRAPKVGVIVLENLRFHEGEEANDPKFARELARVSGARYFVQDGFGVVHRAHASTEAICDFVPSVAGYLLEKEYTTIKNAMRSPEKPLVAIMGGAKISDKIKIIEKMTKKADNILIGGAMANTFLSEKGYKMGKSVYETDKSDTVDKIYDKAGEIVGHRNVDKLIVLPKDLAVSGSTAESATRQEVTLLGVKDGKLALDIGKKTVKEFSEIIKNAKTIIWNGNLGMTEIPAFRYGSEQIAEAIIANKEATSIVGGGDTADFVLSLGKKKSNQFSHISTGGGASLELMSGKRLPGIESLLDA